VFQTASFRLAAVYALIFGLSAGVLAAVAYFTATAALDQQTRTRISADAELLNHEYQSGGYARMMDAIRERQRGRLAGGLDYTVFDARGRNLVGNLPHKPPAAGWQEMTDLPTAMKHRANWSGLSSTPHRCRTAGGWSSETMSARAKCWVVPF
jgi:hypothetical protein